MKQLLKQSQPYKLILAARNTTEAQAAYDALDYDGSMHKLTILPAELSSLKTVKSFAEQALNKLGNDKLDYLMLNAGMTEPPGTKSSEGSKWSDSFVVNHLCMSFSNTGQRLLRP